MADAQGEEEYDAAFPLKNLEIPNPLMVCQSPRDCCEKGSGTSSLMPLSQELIGSFWLDQRMNPLHGNQEDLLEKETDSAEHFSNNNSTSTNNI